YSPDDLSGKEECRRDLLAAAGLPREPDLPVVGIVSRLVPQKGYDVVVEAWHDLLQRPLRMVVLGTGETRVEPGFRELAARALDQALAAWRDRPSWQRLMRNGMSRDFSWERSAEAYVDVYRRALAKA